MSRLAWVREQYPELVASGETLYHTTCVSQGCNQIAQLLGIRTNQYLRTRLGAMPKESQADLKPVALLVRRREEAKKKPARIIQNHDEVAKAVRDAGWDVRIFDAAARLSAEEQCRLFHAAEMVVGPHGAGFTNMLCSCAGTTIVEIKQSDSGFNPSVQIVAEALKFNWIGLETKPPFSLPFYGEGQVNASLVGEAATAVLRNRTLGLQKRRCAV